MSKLSFQKDEVSTLSFHYEGKLTLDKIMDFFLKHKPLDLYFIPTANGFEINILCQASQEFYFFSLITHNFTTDVRLTRQKRFKLWRDIIQVEIANKSIQVKCSYVIKDHKKKYLQIKPEYEDCKKAALDLKRPIQKVYRQAKIKAYQALNLDMP